MLVLHLPDDIEHRLAELARRTGRTKSFYAREAILTHLDDLGDAHLAEVRAAEFRESGERAIPLSDVMDEYGLTGRADPLRPHATCASWTSRLPSASSSTSGTGWRPPMTPAPSAVH